MSSATPRSGARRSSRCLPASGRRTSRDEEFGWWFDRNPAGEGIVSLAVDGGEVVGVAAMSFFRTRLNGVETRLAIPVNVATDARYRGQGVFSTLEHANEEAAAASGSPLTVTFPNAKSYPIFVRRLGWIDLPRLRLWARPLRVSGVVRYLFGRTGERETIARAELERTHDPRARDPSGRALRRGHGRARPARRGRLREPLHARRRVLQLALPRLAPRLPLLRRVPRAASWSGVAVVGHTFKHGVSAGFLADLVAAPEDARR